jgi:hypothetical protein
MRAALLELLINIVVISTKETKVGSFFLFPK